MGFLVLCLGMLSGTVRLGLHTCWGFGCSGFGVLGLLTLLSFAFCIGCLRELGFACLLWSWYNTVFWVYCGLVYVCV